MFATYLRTFPGVILFVDELLVLALVGKQSHRAFYFFISPVTPSSATPLPLFSPATQCISSAPSCWRSACWPLPPRGVSLLGRGGTLTSGASEIPATAPPAGQSGSSLIHQQHHRHCALPPRASPTGPTSHPRPARPARRLRCAPQSRCLCCALMSCRKPARQPCSPLYTSALPAGYAAFAPP